MAYAAPSTQVTGYSVTAVDWNLLVNDILADCAATLTTTGDMVYASGANALARLAIGSANKILTSTGSAPQWSTALTGLTGITLASGALTLQATASKIVPGATSLSLRNNADSADNLLITDAGVITARSTMGGLTGLAVAGTAASVLTVASSQATTVSPIASFYAASLNSGADVNLLLGVSGSGDASGALQWHHDSTAANRYLGFGVSGQAVALKVLQTGIVSVTNGLTVAAGSVSLPAASLSPAAMNAPRVFWHGGSRTLTASYVNITAGVTEDIDTNAIHSAGVITFTAATAGTYLVSVTALGIVAATDVVSMRIALNGAAANGSYIECDGDSGGKAGIPISLVTQVAVVNGDTIAIQATAAATSFVSNVALSAVRIA